MREGGISIFELRYEYKFHLRVMNGSRVWVKDILFFWVFLGFWMNSCEKSLFPVFVSFLMRKLKGKMSCLMFSLIICRLQRKSAQEKTGGYSHCYREQFPKVLAIFMWIFPRRNRSQDFKSLKLKVKASKNEFWHWTRGWIWEDVHGGPLVGNGSVKHI